MTSFSRTILWSEAAELCGLDPRCDYHNDRHPIPIDFVRSITSDPDNPTPKLVLADWLTDRGDDRGELIRVECELREMGIMLGPDDRRWVGPPYLGSSTAVVRGTALADRRSALRRQLGYDRPADAVCPECDGNGSIAAISMGRATVTQCPRCGGTSRVNSAESV